MGSPIVIGRPAGPWAEQQDFGSCVYRGIPWGYDGLQFYFATEQPGTMMFESGAEKVTVQAGRNTYVVQVQSGFMPVVMRVDGRDHVFQVQQISRDVASRIASMDAHGDSEEVQLEALRQLRGLGLIDF
ncbi:MAG TPA: hypothetical protein EYQ05_03385 [Gammaproteobacteria bacterium]|nr:hypothetical protein [Gammaproteobacteria bacterium]